MPYSRDQLNKLDSSNYKPIVSELEKKLKSGAILTLAEAEFICGYLSAGRKDSVIEPFSGCDNFLFRERYLIYIRNANLNGWQKTEDAHGEIAFSDRMKHAAFLHTAFENWQKIMNGRVKGTDIILDFVVDEYKQQKLKLEEYCKSAGITGFYKDYFDKSLVLHARMIYLLVREFYEELNSINETVNLFGHPILIDGYFYVHTMFRHFAEHLKVHQIAKSYHFDKNIHFRRVPAFAKDIIIKFKSVAQQTMFVDGSIYFIFRGKPYALHLTKKGSQFRAATLYPIEKKELLTDLNARTQLVFDPELIFLV